MDTKKVAEGFKKTPAKRMFRLTGANIRCFRGANRLPYVNPTMFFLFRIPDFYHLLLHVFERFRMLLQFSTVRH